MDNFSSKVQKILLNLHLFIELSFPYGVYVSQNVCVYERERKREKERKRKRKERERERGGRE